MQLLRSAVMYCLQTYWVDIVILHILLVTVVIDISEAGASTKSHFGIRPSFIHSACPDIARPPNPPPPSPVAKQGEHARYSRLS